MCAIMVNPWDVPVNNALEFTSDEYLLSTWVENPELVDLLYILNFHIPVLKASHCDSRLELDFSGLEGDLAMSETTIRVASLAYAEYNLGLVLS